MMIRLISVLAFLFNCTASYSKVPAPEAKASTKPSYEIKVGDSLKKQIAKITVKDSNLKTQKLSSLIQGKDTLLIFVKPGCVFCESLMVITDALKPKIRPTLVVALDAAHATEEDFKNKIKKTPNVKAIWVYDYKNKLGTDLGMVSFPRLVHLDKDQKVLANQIGLVIPADKKSLEGLEFPVVLQKLSENTVQWMVSL